MSKPDLSTVEGVRHELFDVFVSGERHTPESGDVLIAYIAEAVKFFEQHKDCECVKHTGNE